MHATGGGVDYGSGPYTVTIPAGNTNATLSIAITDDSINEGNEDFTVAIVASSLPDDCTIGPVGSATVQIVDDDGK